MHHHFKELTSTNLWMKENATSLGNFDMVTADFQTAGRGQRGNGWESAPGENLLMSMLFRPDSLHAKDQFLISKIASVAVAKVVEQLLPSGTEVKIKWPNDIYVNEKKVCGMLVENSIGQDASIQHSVIGIGLNLNQMEFMSDAPNPASLRQFVPGDASRFEPIEVGEMIRSEFENLITEWQNSEVVERVDLQYNSRLRGFHEFKPYVVLEHSSAPAPTAIVNPDNHETIEAAIESVAPDGQLHMILRDGAPRSFYFKEIAPII